MFKSELQVGKYYAQFSFYGSEEWVHMIYITGIASDGEFLERTYVIQDDGWIDNDEIDIEEYGVCYFEGDAYIEITKELYEEALSYANLYEENFEKSKYYIDMLREMSRGHWRNVELEH